MGSQIGILWRRIGSAFYLNAPSAAGLLTQVVTLPIVLANLPVKDYGLYQFILALEIWLNIFSIPQLGFGAKRGIVRGLEGTLLFAFLIRLRLFLLIGGLVWISAFILWRMGEFETLSILLLMFGAYLPLGVLPQATWKQYFIAKKQFHQYGWWRVIGQVLAPVGGVLAAIQTNNIIIFAAAQFGISTFLSLAAFAYILRKYPLIQAYKEGAIDREVVSYGVRLLPASFAVSASEKGANLIIGSFFGFANLAVFSVADKLVSLFKNFLNTGSHLFYTDFAKLSWEALVAKVQKHFVLGLIVAIAISIPFVAAGYLYIDLFMPDAYQTAKLYLLILGLALPPLALKGVMQAVLESNFKTKEILIVSIVPNAMRLLLFLVAGFLFGLLGIVWVIVISAWIEYGFYHVLILRPKLRALRI